MDSRGEEKENTPKLTKATVDKASYQGSKEKNERCLLMDGEIAGFGLRIYPSGKKTFILRYRTAENRQRMITLGAHGVLTLYEARNKARLFLAEKIQGKDPLEDRQTRRHGESIEDLCNAFLDRHAKVHKKSWKEDERRINRHILPAWKNRKIESVTSRDVAQFHHKLGSTAPYEANRVAELLHKMFKLAVVWGFLPRGSINPASEIEKYEEKKRERWIRPDEIPALFQAIEAQENIYARGAVLLYLLTGVRKNELLKANWNQVNFERRELFLEDTKAGRSHIVPLSEPAIEILKGLPRLKGNHYIIPGEKEGEHYVNLQRAWEAIRKRAKMPDIRLHDLRRTVGSWLAIEGYSLLVIGKTLNQTSPQATMIYARMSEDPVRKALDALGAKLAEVAGKSPVAAVIPFPQDHARKQGGKKSR